MREPSFEWEAFVVERDSLLDECWNGRVSSMGQKAWLVWGILVSVVRFVLFKSREVL